MVQQSSGTIEVMTAKLLSWWSHPRFAKARPTIIDMAVPAGCYYVLHSWWGYSTIFAFSIAAVILCSRVAVTAYRERKIDSLQILILASTLVSLLLAFLAHDSRIALLRGSIYSGILGVGCLITTFYGTPLLERLVHPGLSLVSPELSTAWGRCWKKNSAFRRRVRQLNFLYAVSFLLSALARVVVVYSIREEIAVIAGSIPGGIISLVTALTTAVLARPLLTILDTERALIEEENTTQEQGESVPSLPQKTHPLVE